MGFVDKNNTVQLNAYYTQKGRIFYINGQEADKVVKYFSLGDSDTNYQISTDTGNILTSGFVSDVTGDVDDCLTSVSDGVNLKSLVYRQKQNLTAEGLPDTDLPVDSNYELRLNNYLSSQLPIAKNFTTCTVDLAGYIAYLNKFGTYSVSPSDNFNQNQTELHSLNRLFDYVELHDNTLNISYPSVNNISYEMSDADYKLFEQLNRFLLLSGATSTISTAPYVNYQTSPLHFISTNKFIDLGINNRVLGYGNWSITNGVYSLIDFKPFSSVITDYITNNPQNNPVNNFTATINAGQQVIRPTVQLNYYVNNTLYTEYYILRTDYSTKFNTTVSASNQYIKSFVDYNTNKSLITRECELLASFITNRIDLFDSIGGVYQTKPLNIRVKMDNPYNLKVKDAVLKVILKYNPSTTYNPTITNTFVTLT